MGIRPLPLSLMTGLRNLVDHLPPPGYWDFLYNRSVVEFLDLLNVNSTYYACIQQGLVAGVEHGKSGRELSVVAAYDPGVKAKYEEAVGGIGEYFPFFLDRLKSYKDAPLDRVMASFYLEGFPNVEDETLEFSRLWKPPMLVLGGIDRVYPRTWLLWKFFTSGPDDHSLVATVAPLNTLVDADYQISSLAIIDNIVSIAEPHDDMLDATVLDKPVDFKFF
nr:hypothetical protein [Tanacetum cinerariifolium]